MKSVADTFSEVAVQETEGPESRFQIELSDGRAAVAQSSASPEFTCKDKVWAAIATGELPAARAVAMGLADAAHSITTDLLNAFTAGPTPFTHEYF